MGMGILRKFGSGKGQSWVRGRDNSFRKGGLGKGRKGKQGFGKGKAWAPRYERPVRWGSGGDKGGKKGGRKGKRKDGFQRDRYMFAEDMKGGKGKSKGRLGKGRKGKRSNYDGFGRKGGNKGKERELPGVWRHDLWEVVADNFGRKRGPSFDRGKGAGEKRRRPLRV